MQSGRLRPTPHAGRSVGARRCRRFAPSWSPAQRTWRRACTAARRNADDRFITPDGFRASLRAARAVPAGDRLPFPPLTTQAGSGAGPVVPWRSELFASANPVVLDSPRPDTGRHRPALVHGTDEQRETYLPKLITGEWTATMNLTEPDCRLRSRRRPDTCCPRRRRHLAHIKRRPPRRLVPDAAAAPGRRARRRGRPRPRRQHPTRRRDGVPCLLELSRQRPVTDLAWVRLEPWRQVLVRLLSGTAFGAFASGVRRIESEGETGHRLLLAGWLMNRLGVAPDVVRVIDAEHPTLRLWAEHDGRHTSIAVDSPVESAEVRGSRCLMHASHPVGRWFGRSGHRSPSGPRRSTSVLVTPCGRKRSSGRSGWRHGGDDCTAANTHAIT